MNVGKLGVNVGKLGVNVGKLGVNVGKLGEGVQGLPAPPEPPQALTLTARHPKKPVRTGEVQITYEPSVQV